MAEYLDEDGNRVDPADLHKYEVVDAPTPAAPRPAERPAVAVSSATAPRGGGGGLKVAAAVVVTAAVVVVGAGFSAVKAGWINPGATTAAPSASATAAPTTGPGTTTATGPATTTTATAAPTTAPTAVTEVANTRYTGARWPSTSIKPPSVRLRITDSVALPGSTKDLWSDNVAQAFDRFAPWSAVVLTGPDTLTVQTVSRNRPGKPWAEAVVSIKDGKPRVVSENSGANVNDAPELADTDGIEPDTDSMAYRVEGEGIPDSAHGKRKNSATVSSIKRDSAKGSSVVWVVMGDKLFRAVVEDTSASTDDATETEATTEKGGN